MRDALILPAPDVRPTHPLTLALMLAAAVTACSTTTPVLRGPGPMPAPLPFPGPAPLEPRFVSAPPSQCVPFARSLSGIDLRGNANTWWAQAAGLYPRSSTPAVGSVIVINSTGLGHVAVVTRIVSDREILVDHANWHGREEVAVNVPVRDVSEDNSWSQVNVWWLDTNQWGSKIYTVEGFIHPR